MDYEKAETAAFKRVVDTLHLRLSGNGEFGQFVFDSFKAIADELADTLFADKPFGALFNVAPPPPPPPPPEYGQQGNVTNAPNPYTLTPAQLEASKKSNYQPFDRVNASIGFSIHETDRNFIFLYVSIPFNQILETIDPNPYSSDGFVIKLEFYADIPGMRPREISSSFEPPFPSTRFQKRSILDRTVLMDLRSSSISPNNMLGLSQLPFEAEDGSEEDLTISKAIRLFTINDDDEEVFNGYTVDDMPNIVNFMLNSNVLTIDSGTSIKDAKSRPNIVIGKQLQYCIKEEMVTCLAVGIKQQFEDRCSKIIEFCVLKQAIRLELRLQSGDVLKVNFSPNNPIRNEDWNLTVCESFDWSYQGESVGILKRPLVPLNDDAIEKDKKAFRPLVGTILPAVDGTLSEDAGPSMERMPKINSMPSSTFAGSRTCPSSTGRHSRLSHYNRDQFPDQYGR
ncbi:hypothetical protein EAE99_004573 [Botrytis elliptica]|nr:hypothetical protein EAE99_004573 [Botrytis elliptica]